MQKCSAATCLRAAGNTVSLNNLKTFPWIHERVEQGTLALHGWYFDIEPGDCWATTRLPASLKDAVTCRSIPYSEPYPHRSGHPSRPFRL